MLLQCRLLDQLAVVHPFRSPLIADIPPSHFVNLQSSLDEHLLDGIERKESQVCSVEQSLIGIGPLPAEQVADDGPVLNVGDAGENLGAGGERAGKDFKGDPRVNQVLKDVTRTRQSARYKPITSRKQQ